MKGDNYEFLTQAPVPRVIGTMSVSTIISMLVVTIYNMVDTFFVGQIDTQSTAAVGLVFPLMYIMQSVAFFFGHGTGNYISRQLGARRRSDAEKMASTGFFYSLAVGVVIMLAGLSMSERLALFLGATPTTLAPTIEYMTIVLLGTPFMTAQFTLNGQMRFQGNAALAMIGVATGAVMNIILDPILIFGFDMGVAGAAWATVVGQISSFVLLLILTHYRDNIHIQWRQFTSSFALVREIVAGGTPSLMRQMLGSVATIMLNVVAAHYGDAAIAAMSIVNRIALFIMSAVIGLGQGYQPLCGFCYGAGLFPRVRKGFWFCTRVGTVFLLVCAVFGFIFSDSIIALFRNDPEVIAIGSEALRWQVAVLPLGALSMFSNMMMQTVGMTWRANVLAACRCGIFFIPLILLLPRWFGLAGVEACQAVSDVFTFLVTVPILYGVLRELR